MDVGGAAQGMWRTPHPGPGPLDGPTKGLSGAVAIGMVYLADGTVVFAERPHPLAQGIPNNPLIVNVSAGASLSVLKRYAAVKDVSVPAWLSHCTDNRLGRSAVTCNCNCVVASLDGSYWSQEALSSLSSGLHCSTCRLGQAWVPAMRLPLQRKINLTLIDAG